MIASYFEVVAIKDHKPVHQSQLLFKRGERIIVVETAPTGWWKGEIGNRKGLFPESYVSSQPSASMVTSPLPTSPLVHTIITSTPPINNNGNGKDESNYHGRLSPPPHVVIAEPSTTSSSSIPTIPINKMKQHSTPLNNVTFCDPPSVTISIGQGGSPSITSPSIESPKKSPRFNISPTDIANSAPRLTSHTRKNSGPSKTISSTIEDQEEFGDNDDTHTGGSVSPNGNGGKPKITYNSATVNVNHLKQYQSQQYPGSNHATLGKPRSPIFGQPGRISVSDVNKEVPYYITRVIESYQKSGFDELDIHVGDLIVIYNKKTIDSDWWVGKLGNGFGVLPKKCVEIIRDLEVIPLPSSLNNNNNTTSTSQPPPPPTINITTSGNQLPPPPPPTTMPTTTSSYKYDISSTYKKGIAIATYNSQFATYLSFKKGDIMVLESKEGEFWKARIGSQVGLVSPNYIKEHDVQPLSYAQVYENTSTTPVPTIQTTAPPPTSTSNNTSTSTAAAFKLPPTTTNTTNTNNVNNETTPPVKLPTANGNNHVNNNNNTTSKPNEISSSTSSSFESDTKSETDDDTIARKIRDSLSHFQTREELLEAVQNLAIKFVKQSSILKKEIQQEQLEKQQLENELKLLKQKYNI